jgi:uncharacterized membrane protein SirB2
MIEYYLQIKQVHVAMVLASVSLFALRGAGVIAGMAWPRMAPVRWTSYAIDTTLLTAALMLLTILPWAMFANGWLVTKIVLLVVYIVMGVQALRERTRRAARVGWYLGALLVFGFIYSVARANHPAGVFLRLLS